MISLIATVVALSAPQFETAVICGQKSSITERQYHLIDNQAKLSEVWRLHSTEPAPTLNERTSMSLLIFSGRSVNSLGVKISSVEEQADSIRVRYTQHHFGSFRGGVECQPWAMVILPRTTKPILVEENVQANKWDPDLWEPRQTLRLPE